MKIKWKIFSVSFLCLFLIVGCTNRGRGIKEDSNLTSEIVEITKASIAQKELLEHLEFLTSEELAGRPSGNWDTGISPETIMVTDYLKEKCKDWKLQPAGEKQSPDQHFRVKVVCGYDYWPTVKDDKGRILVKLGLKELMKRGTRAGDIVYIPADSLNIAFYLPGIEFPEEYIVLVAHFDHIGDGSGKSGTSQSPPKYKGKQIHPGAADNGSGVSSLLELAQAFSDLYEKGIKPKRSIVFLFSGAEEVGLQGASYYAINFPLDGEIVTAIALDCLSRGPALDSFRLVACPLIDEAPKRIPEIFSYIKKWKDGFGFSKVNYSPGADFYLADHYPFWASSPEDNRIPSLLLTAGFDHKKHEEYLKELSAVYYGEKLDVDKDKRFYFHTIWDTLYDEEGNLNIDLAHLERFSEFLTILVWELANGPKPDYVEQLD